MGLTNATVDFPDLDGAPTFGSSWENKYPYPSFELPSGMVTIRTNGVVNPALATGATGWGGSGVGSVLGTPARSAGAGHGGSVGWQSTATGTLTPGAHGLQVGNSTGDHVVVTAGETTFPSMYVHSTRASRFGLLLAFYDISNAMIGGTVSVAAAQVAANTQTRLQALAGTVVPASAVRMLIRVVPVTGTGYDPIIAGDVLTVSKASTAPGPYFDGNTPATGDFEYVWSGTANASTSIMRAKGLPGASVSNAVAYQSQEWASEGDSSVCVLPNTSNPASFVEFAALPVTAGDQWTLIAVAHLDAPLTGTLAPQARRLMARFYEGSENFLSDAFPNIAGDHEVRLVVTIPAGRTIMTPRLYNGASLGNGEVRWDLLTIVPGVYTGPPFSGDSQIPGYLMEWLGTPDESASTLTEVQTHENRVKEVVSWSITEPGTPHNIARSTGSTGVANITSKAREDSYWTISEPARVNVDGLAGTAVGTVSDVRITPYHEFGEPGGITQVTIASRLDLLNADRTLAPVLNTPLSEVFTQYVAAVTDELDVQWLASTDPIRTYGAWSGNVWSILKTLCAVNRVEIGVDGNQMIVRDVGVRVLDLDDIEDVAITISPGTGQYVEITSRNAQAIDNQMTFNYAGNPSVEVNADGWDASVYRFGSISVSRVTN